MRAGQGRRSRRCNQLLLLQLLLLNRSSAANVAAWRDFERQEPREAQEAVDGTDAQSRAFSRRDSVAPLLRDGHHARQVRQLQILSNKLRTLPLETRSNLEDEEQWNVAKRNPSDCFARQLFPVHARSNRAQRVVPAPEIRTWRRLDSRTDERVIERNGDADDPPLPSSACASLCERVLSFSALANRRTATTDQKPKPNTFTVSPRVRWIQTSLGACCRESR